MAKLKFLFIIPPDPSDLGSVHEPEWRLCRIPPMGVISIMSFLHARGHSAKLVDCRFVAHRYGTADYIPHLLQLVREYNPDIAGICMLTALFGQSRLIAQSMRKAFPLLPLIAGGPHPSILPKLTLQQIDELDAVCIGMGEETSLAILEQGGLKGIPGLMLSGREVEYVPRTTFMEMDSFPFLNYDLVPVQDYASFSAGFTTFGWLTRSLGAMTTRSCPYSCKFCASDWSKPFQSHSAEYVVELAKVLARYDIDTLSFWDDIMAYNRDRMEAICEGFIRSGLFKPGGRLRWRCSSRANLVDPELLTLMKAAGCYSVSMGFETGSDAMLKHVNKKTTVEMNRRAAEAVKAAGLDLLVSWMVGIPGETQEDALQTLRMMEEVGTNSMGCGNFRPLPGSPFYYEFVRQGLIDEKNVNWDNLGNFSQLPEQVFCEMPKDTLYPLIRRAEEIAYGHQHVAVYDDIAREFPGLLNEIGQRLVIKMAAEDNYHSSAHQPLPASTH